MAVLNPMAIRPRNVGTVFVQDTTVYFTLSNGVVYSVENRTATQSHLFDFEGPEFHVDLV